MKKFYPCSIVICMLLAVVPGLFAADVPNAPSLTGFGGKTVVAGETIYTNNNQQGVAQPDVPIEGSAQASTAITLYADGVELTQTSPATIITGTDGKWSATVTMDTGEFDITATASNEAGASLHSESVHVVLDTTPPDIVVTVRLIGSMTNQVYMRRVNTIYGTLSDSASGVDWSTATISLKNKTTNQNVSGIQQNDGAELIDFTPTNGDWDTASEETNLYRITVTATDIAGNSGSNYREYTVDSTPPPAPNITHIYDQGQWKAYSSGMTVNTNPPKLKGTITPVNYFNEGPNAYALFDSRFHRSSWSYCTTDNGQININNGAFVYEYQEGEYFQQGSETISIYAGDSARNRTTKSIVLNFTYGTPAPPSVPSSPDFCSLYNCYGGDKQVIGSAVVPDMSGTITRQNYVQTVRIFEAPQQRSYWTGSRYNYSMEILPQGQVYQNTPGVYDQGELYADANDNYQYDSGEQFLDNNSKGTSDGRSYTFTNFLNYEYRNNSNSYIKIAVANQYGGSEAISIGRFHHRTIAPEIQSITISPAQSPYLSSSQKPTQIAVNVQVSGYDWRPQFYGLNESSSKLQILDNNNTVITTKTTTWTDLQNLRYEGIFNVSGVTFQPQKLYTVRITAVDLMTNQTVEDTYSFFIDTLDPQVVDIIPAPGSEIGRLPNFQATLFDTSSGGLNGSGISFGNGDQAIDDLSYSQLRPFRVIDTATASAGKLVVQGPVTGYDSSDITALGTEFEVWVANDSQTVGTVAISDIDGSQITLSPVNCTLQNGSSYTILQPIPYYHANNALDTLSANPIYPITESGFYAVQVQAVDKVGNTSITSSVYEFGEEEPIEYNPPTGSFTMSADPSTALAGTVITVESEVITTLNGTPVSDGTLVTVSTTHGTILNADQDQFTVGAQVTTSGGKVTFQVQSTQIGTGSVHAEVAEAYSSPDPLIEFIPDYPFGEYTLQASPAVLTADGATTITVTGPTVTDRYGNIITDSNAPHNLFTVTVPGCTIITPDIAPGTSGHQITPQADGTLFIELQAGITAQSTTVNLSSISQSGTPAAPTAWGSVGLTLQPGDPAQSIVLNTSNDTLIAQSAETSLITSSPITDQFGNVVPDGTLITVAAGHGTITSSDADGTTPGIQRTTNAGVITFQVTAQGVSVGDGTITAQSVNGSATGQLTLHFVADVPQGTITLTPVPAQLVADGAAISVISSSIIHDQYGNSIGAGQDVQITTSAGLIRPDGQSAWNAGPVVVQTASDGSVSFELQASITVEQADITAQTLTGTAEGSCNVNFIPGSPTGTITLNSNLTEVIAGSSQTIVITGTVEDAFNHPVADGTQITMAITQGTVLTTDTNPVTNGVQVETTDGSFTFRLTAQNGSVGASQVTAVSVSGDAVGELDLSFIAGQPEQPFSLVASPDSILADGQTTAFVTGSVIRDSYGNAVAQGELITVTASLGTILTGDADAQATGVQLEVDNTGRISFVIESATASGTAQLNAASVEGTAAGSGSVVFHPGIPAQPIALTASPDELIANSGQVSQIISGTILDAFNNTVADGTLITIGTDLGELSATDNDGNPANGLQVQTDNGVISFELLSELAPPDRIEAGTALITAYGEGEPGSRAEGSVAVEFVYDDPYQPIVLHAQSAPLVADNTSSTLITSDPLKDQYDNIMDQGVLVTVSTNLGQILEDEAPGITGNQVSTDASGQISFTLQAGTVAGTATVSALSYVGTAQGQLQVAVNAGAPDGTITLHSEVSELVLDYISSSTITSDPITDMYGNTVNNGTMITVSSNNGAVTTSDADIGTPGTQVPTVNGIITFELSSDGGTLGTALIEAESIGQAAYGSMELTFVPGAPSGAVTLTPSPASIVADPNEISPVAGITTITTLTSSVITDAAGNVTADGELITVYTNRGVITSADADPLIGGIQVAVSAGTIICELSSQGASVGTATVYASSVNGTASGSAQVAFTDTGVIDSIQIILDEDRPDSDRYVPWNMSRAVIVACQDIMGNPATGDTVSLTMLQNQSGSGFSAYTGYPGSGDSQTFSGQTDAAGRFLVTYTTPQYTGQPDDREDILDAYSAAVTGDDVDNRRFIVTTTVPPLFRFYAMQPVAQAGEFHPIQLEIIDQYDTHITDVTTIFPSLQALLNIEPAPHTTSGDFYRYDQGSQMYISLGQNSPTALPWDQNGYATIYYRDTNVGVMTVTVADNEANGVKTASKNLEVLSGSIITGGVPDLVLAASPAQIVANATSISTVTSDPVTDAYGNVIAGQIVTVSTDHGSIIAVDVDGNSANGIQVATDSSGVFSFSVRSELSVVTASVNAVTMAGGPSGSTSIDFIAGNPSGNIILIPDQNEVAADPSNTISFTSSPLTDQWGNTVAAGQPVTVSATLGTITTADEDGNAANGIQVAVAADGTISFTVQASSQAGTAMVSASSVNGSATGNVSVGFIPGEPQGTIVLYANPSQVIANGPNNSVITSDPITDGTNVVKDGELFTVSATGGTIVALDESPLDGIQVLSSNGVISCVFNPNTDKGSVNITAQSVDGAASGSVGVTLTSGVRSAGTIVLHTQPASILADGITTSAITSDPLYDRYGNLLDAGVPFTVTASRGVFQSTGTSTATIITDAAGQLMCTLQSATVAGLATVNVQCVNNPASNGSAGVQFTPGSASGTITLQAIPDELIANSQSLATVQVPAGYPITDVNGNIVADGTLVTLQTDLGHLIDAGQEVTQMQVAASGGLISVSFKATQGPGTAHIIATCDTAQGGVDVGLTEGVPYQPITLSASPDSIVADGSGSTTITSGVIRDEFLNQVPVGTPITVSTTAGVITTADADPAASGVQVFVDAQGIISFTVRSATTAGPATVRAQSVTGPAEGTVAVTFIPGDPAGTITLNAVPGTLIAKSDQVASITSSVIKDAHGNPVGEGMSVTVATTNGLLNGTASPVTVQTNASGKIEFNLVADVSSVIDVAQVTAQSDIGSAQTATALQVPFTADVPSGGISLDASPQVIVADGSSTSSITSGIVTDAYGNQVPEGTLVTIDTSWGSVMEHDADPVNYPDHQIAVGADGTISFSIQSETSVGTAHVTAQSVEGTAAGSVQVTGKAGGTVDLIVVMPGETFDVAEPDFIAGTPLDQTINVSFDVTVFAIDAFGNIVTDETEEIELSALSSFTQCAPSFTQSFNGTTGQLVFTVEDTIAGQNLNISVADTASATLSGTGSTFDIRAGQAVQLQIILPGQTAVAGDSGDGVQGSPLAQNAGVSFPVAVNYVDQFYNIVAEASGTVQLRSSGLNADRPENISLQNGTCTFSMTERTLTPPGGPLRRLTASLIGESINTVSDDFEVVDTLAPEVLSFTIENGAQHTATQNVSLQVNAVDDAGSAIEMQFRNENQTWDQAGAFVPYQAETTGYLLSSGLGAKTVSVRVRDANGYVSQEHSASIMYATPPSASAGGDYTGVEGDTITFDAAATTDPDANESLTFEWDLDGDGEFDDASTAQVSIQYTDNIQVAVSVRVTDKYGLISTDTADLTITNADPSVVSLDDRVWPVDQMVVIDPIGFTDLGTADTHTASVDWGDGTVDQIGAVSAGTPFTASYTYTQPGDFTVTVTVTDDDSGSGTASFTATVRYEPVADAGDDYSGYEGNSITLDATGSYDNDMSDMLSYAWDIDGDGQFDDAFTQTVDYTWDDEYAGTVAVQVTDSYGFAATDTAQVEIYNAAPAILSSFDDRSIEEGETVDLNIEFSDSGPNDTHTVSVDWGYVDNQSQPVVDEITDADSPSGISHMFTGHGVYTVTVTVTDSGGGQDSRSFTVDVGIETITFSIVVEDDRTVAITFDPVAGKEYEILFSDSDSALDAVSVSAWQSAGVAQNGSFNDSGDADGADDIAGTADDRAHPNSVPVRYYRIARTDSIDAAGTRCCSQEIGYVRSILLVPGRNFVGVCGSEQTLQEAFDARFLYGSISHDNTRIFYSRNDLTYQASVVDPENGSHYFWLDTNGSDGAAGYPVSAGQGCMLTNPPGAVVMSIPKCGFINQNGQTTITIQSSMTLVAWPYASSVSLDDCGLVQSGFRGDIRARTADMLYFWNPQTQSYDLPVFYFTGTGQWRYYDQSHCTRMLKPGEAVLIKKQSTSAFSEWVAPKPYGDHGKTIAP